MSRTPETSNPHFNSQSGGGRFARSNPGGPGRPRGAVRGAASALDRLAAEVLVELIKGAIDPGRAGNLEALKRVRTRLWPQWRGIRKGDHERRLRALEDALLEVPEKSPELQAGQPLRAIFPNASRSSRAS